MKQMTIYNSILLIYFIKTKKKCFEKSTDLQEKQKVNKASKQLP